MPPKGSKKLDAKQAARLRRQQLEEQKRLRARRERQRTWLLSGLAVLIGAGLIAAVVVPQALKPTPVTERALASFGTSPSKAGCDAPKSPKPGTDTVIGPGSKNPKQTKGSYQVAPPVGGDHYATPLPLDNHFLAVSDHPKVEQLVANELQGATVAWYLPALPAKEVKSLRQLSQRMAVDNPDFVVAPWDPSYGAFPAGKQVAFATKGHVEYCAKVSGAAAQTFVQRFPAVAAQPSPPASAPASAPASGSPSPTGSAAPSASRTSGKGGTGAGHKASASPSPTKS